MPHVPTSTIGQTPNAGSEFTLLQEIQLLPASGWWRSRGEFYLEVTHQPWKLMVPVGCCWRWLHDFIHMTTFTDLYTKTTY